MPRRPRRIPSYRLHKFSGLAVVTIDGHDHYLGLHDTPESKQKYARLIQEWTANQYLPQSPACTPDASSLTDTIAESSLFCRVLGICWHSVSSA